LNAARKVFAQKGRVATMADIANAAEVSQGLAYRYFPNKEAIFQILVDQLLAQTSGAVMPQLKSMPGTPGQRLEHYITTIVNSRRQYPEFFQLFYRVLSDETTPDDLRNLIKQRGLEAQNLIRELIVEGQATGEIAQDDPDQLLGAVMACIEGLWRGMVLLEPEQVKQSFPDGKIIFRMLKPDPDQK
jgi:AcrR family transcriptional regulator